MKTMVRFFTLSVLCISLVACKSQKNTTAASPQNTTTASNVAPDKSRPAVAEPVVVPKEGTVRFVVSFYSKGEGIDLKTKEEFTKFLDAYPKKIGYEPIAWGREGELDYCLSLNSFSAGEQAEFVRKAKTILAKSQLVNTKENASCDHASWPAVGTIDDNYRLVVSFYSAGEGPDLKTKEEFEKFLNSSAKKIYFEPANWGREGEMDYCLKLSELSASEQQEFVRKARELLSKSKLVHVNENAKCVHKH